MNKKTEKKGFSTQQKVMMGAGLATLAAAVAGGIFLYGTEAGKRSRKQIKSWTLKMRADVLDRMEVMKDWSEEAYNKVIESVAANYKNLKHVDKAELAALVADMQRHWRTIHRQIQQNGKKRKTNRSQKTTKTT